MLIKRFFLICSVPSFIAGCAEFYGYQPPAPIYQSRPPVYREPDYPPAPQKPPPTRQAPKIVETQPLEESAPVTAPEEIKAEPLSPEQAQELLTPEQEQELASLEHGRKPPEQEQTEEMPQPAESLAPPPQPEPSPEPFEPLETFAPLSPAVDSLVLAANQNSSKGDIESATSTIERAIRIEPRNPALLYKLAVLRLKQSKPGLAEDLARKSALLASNNPQLKKHSWLLIAKAREMRNNFQGAKEARAIANKF
jgi:hypothetical protein